MDDRVEEPLPERLDEYDACWVGVEGWWDRKTAGEVVGVFEEHGLVVEVVYPPDPEAGWSGAVYSHIAQTDDVCWATVAEAEAAIRAAVGEGGGVRIVWVWFREVRPRPRVVAAG